MGDDIKITVIATGFRQGSGERREQMLSAALRTGAAAPRIESRPPTPRFASEEEEDGEIAAPFHADTEKPVLVPVSNRDLKSAFSEPEPEPAMSIEEAPEEDEEQVAVAVSDPGLRRKSR